MNARVWLATVFLGLAAIVACGESTSSDDGGGAGAGDDGPECASDADCEEPLGKCTQAGQCTDENGCDTDADCRGEYKFCDTFHRCEPCRTDTDCPSEMPVCVPGWEFGVYCAVCRLGDSSLCPADTYCAAVTVPVAGGGGVCEASDCAADPMGTACLACVNENAPACYAAGSECSDVLASLEACCVAEDPSWPESGCPIGVVPSARGCIPVACTDEADVVDACLLGCSAVTESCD